MSHVTSQHGRAALWLFVLFSVSYVTLTRGHFQSADEVAVYLQARALWEDGGLAIAPILNTIQGRSGQYYAPFSVGQAVLALPLYGMGKAAHRLLEWVGRDDWIRILAGPLIELGPCRWGGDVEIFAVNLLHAFTTAFLVALFFLFSVRLGATLTASVAASLLVGLCSYIAGFSTGSSSIRAKRCFSSGRSTSCSRIGRVPTGGTACWREFRSARCCSAASNRWCVSPW